MKLYIGGAYQGQEELARRENPEGVFFPDFHETVREAVLKGGAGLCGGILPGTSGGGGHCQ